MVEQDHGQPRSDQQFNQLLNSFLESDDENNRIVDQSVARSVADRGNGIVPLRMMMKS